MVTLILSSLAMMTAQPATANPIDICRPAMARKLEGEISAADVSTTSRRGAVKTVRGNVTALVGMGDPGPGRAKAHHLIRERYSYECSVRSGKVVKLSLNRID